MADIIRNQDRAETADEAIPSHAAIGGHPIHPMLIPFPIAFLVGTLVADMIFLSNNDPFWAQVALWLNAAGVATGGLAAAFGLIDFLSSDRVRNLATAKAHLVANLIVIALATINVLLRVNDPPTGARTGILLSVIVALLLALSGWFGGELVFKHKVGVKQDK